ncbi:hypothetical protein PMJ10TS2_79500 (plasmid) [Paenibacillus melissococcoides]
MHTAELAILIWLVPIEKRQQETKPSNPYFSKNRAERLDMLFSFKFEYFEYYVCYPTITLG